MVVKSRRLELSHPIRKVLFTPPDYGQAPVRDVDAPLLPNMLTPQLQGDSRQFAFPLGVLFRLAAQTTETLTDRRLTRAPFHLMRTFRLVLKPSLHHH